MMWPFVSFGAVKSSSADSRKRPPCAVTHEGRCSMEREVLPGQ